MKKLKAEKVKLKGWIYLPEDEVEADLTFHGIDWALTVWDIDQEIRNRVKYGPEFKTPQEALSWVRETIQDCLETRNLSLDMIT